jgi:hypothetical protein
MERPNVLECAIINGWKVRKVLEDIIGCTGMEEFVMEWKGRQRLDGAKGGANNLIEHLVAIEHCDTPIGRG